MRFVRPPCPSCADGRLLREKVGDGSTRQTCDTCNWPGVGAMGGESKVCRVAGCRDTLKGHGMCKLHYNRWYRAGKPNVSKWLKAGANVGGER